MVVNKQELTIEERRIRDSLITSPNLNVAAIGLDNSLIYINDSCAKMWGYDDVRELLGQPAVKLLELGKKDWEAIEGALWHTGNWEGEIRAIRKDRSIFDAQMFANLTKDATGRPICIVSSFIDITKYKSREEELRASNSQMASLLDAVPDIVIQLDKNMKILWSNKEGLGINPYVVGQTCYKGHLGLEKPCENCYAKLAMETGRSQTGIVFHPIHLLGPSYWETVAVPIRQNRHYGEITGAIGIFRNVTKRELTLKALQDMEQFNTDLLSSFPTPIIVFDKHTSITYVNPAFEKLSKFSRKEVVGCRCPYPWWTENSKNKLERDTQRLICGGLRKAEELFRSKDGKDFWVEVAIVPMRTTGDTEFYVSSWVDITSQKRQRDDMQFYIAEITKAQEEERRRVARELHDETIQQLADLYTDIDKTIDFIEQFSNGGSKTMKILRVKLDNIIDEMRRFSNELRPTSLDHLGLIPSLELLVEDLNEVGIVTNLHVTGSQKRLTPEVEVVLFRIAQEALRNVKKHSKATAAALKIKFLTGKVLMSIADNGKGFDTATVQSDLSRQGKFGLIGINERTRLLGGTLEIKSKPGNGTKLSLEINT